MKDYIKGYITNLIVDCALKECKLLPLYRFLFRKIYNEVMPTIRLLKGSIEINTVKDDKKTSLSFFSRKKLSYVVGYAMIIILLVGIMISPFYWLSNINSSKSHSTYPYTINRNIDESSQFSSSLRKQYNAKSQKERNNNLNIYYDNQSNLVTTSITDTSTTSTTSTISTTSTNSKSSTTTQSFP